MVHERVADTVVGRLQDAFEAIKASLGAGPQDPTTSYGLLVDKAQYEKVLEYIREGKKSAEVLVGAKTQTGAKGYYVVPTIFKKIDRNSNIYWEEIFGPVMCVETFTTEEQALEMANDTEHGLAGEHFWISNRVGINLIYTVGSIYTQDKSCNPSLAPC